MGQGLSAEPKVFLPKSPVDFSPALVSALESSTESDYTRAQKAESQLQSKVREQLERIQSQSQAALQAALDKAVASSDESDNTNSSNVLSEKIAELRRRLDSRPAPTPLTAELAQARDAVVACLQANASKPLKCVDEASRFSRVVSKLEL